MDISREDIPSIRKILRQSVEEMRQASPALATELADRLDADVADDIAVTEALSVLAILAVPVTRRTLQDVLASMRESLRGSPMLEDVAYWGAGSADPEYLGKALRGNPEKDDVEIQDFLSSVYAALSREPDRKA